MTCTYTWTKQCVVKTFTEFVEGNEFVLSAEHVGADPRFETLRIIYNDFLLIDGHSITARVYRRVSASRLGSMWTNPNYRVAFIAVDPTAGELSQAISVGDPAATYHPQLCDTMDEGRAWFARQPALDAPRHRH
jgi:hypothetical protein